MGGRQTTTSKIQKLSGVCPSPIFVHSLSNGPIGHHRLQLMKSKLCPVFVQKQCDQVVDEKIGMSNICLEIDSEFWGEFQSIF